jgi:beta-hydroxylase
MAIQTQLILKTVKKWLKLSLIIIPMCLFAPYFFAVYILFGLLDVSRNRPLNKDTLHRYFIGNGQFTWLLSPFNLLLDLLSARNKGIYKLEDLPTSYQKEITSLLQDVEHHKERIKQELSTRLEDNERGMLLFKWYGENMNTSVELPCFHKQYTYIKTIGVSSFNEQKATSIHYGPIRLSLRLLYNLTPTNEGEVYIQVSDTKHHWKDNPLFIFDDTLQHQSVNYSNQIRHCMFVDIIRPGHCVRLFSILLTGIKILTAKSNNIIYKKWVLLK